MGEMSPWHWAIVILIAVLLFGARRLPDAARSLGRSARILKAELGADSPKEAPVESAASAPTAAPVVASAVEPPAPVTTEPVTTAAPAPAAPVTPVTTAVPDIAAQPADRTHA